MRRGSLRSKFMAASGCLLAALAFGVTACGDDSGDGGGGGGGKSSGGGSKTLTIYSSVPLQGSLRPASEALVNGAKLALEQAGNKAGDFTIKYVSLDDSTAQTGNWAPEATSANALKAVQDKSTVAY